MSQPLFYFITLTHKWAHFYLKQQLHYNILKKRAGSLVSTNTICIDKLIYMLHVLTILLYIQNICIMFINKVLISYHTKFTWYFFQKLKFLRFKKRIWI